MNLLRRLYAFTFQRFHVSTKRGFTLVELIISVAIFVFMTALLVIKYSNFNTNVLLTDVAFKVALEVRDVQQYAVSVQAGKDASFDHVYGLSFDKAYTDRYTFFQNDKFFDDPYGSGLVDYDGSSGGTRLMDYMLRSGVKIHSLCYGYAESSLDCSAPDNLIVEFKRPDPDAHMWAIHHASALSDVWYPINVAKIVLQTADGNTRSVLITKYGQISVSN